MARDAKWGRADFQATVRQELERIGADGPLQLGLASTMPVTPEQILAALRATADGAGSEALLVNLQAELGRAVDGS